MTIRPLITPAKGRSEAGEGQRVQSPVVCTRHPRVGFYAVNLTCRYHENRARQQVRGPTRNRPDGKPHDPPGSQDRSESMSNQQQDWTALVRAHVTAHHPEWTDALRPPLQGEPSIESPVFVLPNPRGDGSRAIEISVEESDRITVFFGRHHAHFSCEAGEAALTGAFGLVVGLVHETVVSVFASYGGRLYVSDFCYVEDLSSVEAASRPPRRRGWLGRLLGLHRETDTGNQTTWRSFGPVHYMLGPPPPGPCHLEVVSWLGTQDRQVVLQ